VSSPRPGVNAYPISELRIGAADSYSGVDWNTLSITCDLPLAGKQPLEELAQLAKQVDDGVVAIRLDRPLVGVTRANLFVSVKDHQGNITRAAVRFSVPEITDN
jgi:hypothetical protein